MTTWKRRIALSSLVLIGTVVVAATIGWFLIRGTPEWYQPLALTTDERDAAAQSATNKLVLVQNQAAQARADERISLKEPKPPATRPANAITISFSDTEINAFFEKWSVWQSVRAGYERFMTEPRIILMDGRVILAGRIKEFDAVASLHFEPRIDPQGRLDMKLVRILAGKLPIPEAVLSQYQQKATNGITQRLPWWRRQADIDPTGIANSSAISAAMGTLLIDVLSNRTSDPILFLPLVEKGSIPVKLTEVEVADHTLKLVVLPMSAQERVDLLRIIRGEAAIEARAQ